LLAARVRSGLEETFHEGAVAVSKPDGTVVAFSGDINRPFFLRSSAKPFQAFVSQSSGAELEPVELAIASASHRGFPVHVALVELMLAKAGLDESHLQCPFAWPLGEGSRRQVISQGKSQTRRIWSDCSGKHAGFLTACVGSGWPVETYLQPDHPLQQRIIEFVSEIGDYPAEPVGVDGCGAPVMRTTVRAMSLMFARLATDSRLAEVFSVMHRYPALVSANGEADASIATALNAAAKGGALGCIGIGLASGTGVAVKSWDGVHQAAAVGAVAALNAIDLVPPAGSTYLETVGRPVMFGGDKPVGHMEPRLELAFS
jgi:L-asparaginase II